MLPRLILGVLLVLIGLLLLAIAVLGSRGTLRRNRWIGIRTPATLRSDASFRLAHRAGAAPLGAAGAVAVVGGIVTVAGNGAVVVVVLAVTAVAVVVLAGVGGAVGHRAAGALAPSTPAACAGVCAGCDLVAGCVAATSPRNPDRP